MSHKIIKAADMDNLLIEATFFDGTVKEYDLKTLIPVIPQFKELQTNRELCKKIHVEEGGYVIAWNKALGLDAAVIWEEGKTVRKDYTGPVMDLAFTLTEARMNAGLTQMELARRAGIYQTDISRIERGLANPSLSTLQKLAEGMGKKLKITFF